MKPVKKKFKESEIMIAFAQYQVARNTQIILKTLSAWFGMNFLVSAPDTFFNYIEQVKINGAKAKDTLVSAGFKFKQGTMKAL